MKKILLTTAILLFLAAVLAAVFSGSGDESDQSSSLDAVKSLPYLTWVPAGGDLDRSGVVSHDQQRAFAGLNIYNSRNKSEAYLMDMEGNVLHTWSAPAEREGENWHHVEMAENGDLLAIIKDRKLVLLDWDSNIKWERSMRVHHDVAFSPDGDIYALVREGMFVKGPHLPMPILNDYIVILSSAGEIKRKVSLYDIMGDTIPPEMVRGAYLWILNPLEVARGINRKVRKGRFFIGKRTAADLFHTNTLEILDRPIPGIAERGDLLISPKSLDLVAVVSLDEARVKWQWGRGELSRQHHPTLLENGNILIFDNGCSRGHSRILEVDPRENEIVWTYADDPPDRFFSYNRGSSQRLPNGNTLVTESDRGRVFEVTPEGDVVWEFFNPETNRDEEVRAAIYRMMRIDDPARYPKVQALLGGSGP